MIDFGLVEAVDAEAIGPPGERTFRIRARMGDQRVSLWLEKEQLVALGHALSRILAERSRQRGRPADPVPEMGHFGDSDVELQVIRFGLDFDAEHEQVVLIADDQEAMERGDTPTFRMMVTRSMALGLIDTIREIIASGRPLCPLCGRPLEGEGRHFCPGANGHSEQPIPDAQQSDQSGEEEG